MHTALLYVMQIAYNIDVVKSNIPEALEVLSDAVLNPRFTSWEVAEAVQKIEQDIKGLKENPQTVLLEVSIPKKAVCATCLHKYLVSAHPDCMCEASHQKAGGQHTVAFCH